MSETFDLMTEAIKAHCEDGRQRYVDKLQARVQRGKEAAAAFERTFGHPADAIDGYEVRSGSVRLAYKPPSWDSDFGKDREGWRVRGKCPRCGAEALSDICNGLADIGRQLETFVPAWGHNCAPRHGPFWRLWHTAPADWITWKRRTE